MQIKLVLQEEKTFFPTTKALRPSITKYILQVITFLLLIDINELNLYIAFKVAWTGFIQLREITYTDAEKHYLLFKNLRLMHSNVAFSKMINIQPCIWNNAKEI